MRYTVAVTFSVSATLVTGSTRATIAGAASGSCDVLPVSPWPLLTVSRFVPSRSISLSSPAWLEEDRPSTATIAATPMAIPSADSPARSGRVRSPTLATRARSPTRILRGARPVEACSAAVLTGAASVLR